MLNAILGTLGINATTGAGKATQSRLSRYIRYKRLYDGFAIRQDVSQSYQYKQLKWNLARPIVNMSADFLAGKGISFTVQDDDEATEKCKDIWLQSGGDSAFMENALLGGILGDALILVRQKEDEDLPCLDWLDPSVCHPTFDPHNIDLMNSLAIMYDVEGESGGIQKYSEVWKQGTVTIRLDDMIQSEEPYDEKAFGGVPAIWIRNQRIKGETYGRSDMEPIADLTEQYDHLCEKQSRIIDYYANPNLKVKGVGKGLLQSSRGERTMYYLPENGDISFVEWEGTAMVGIDAHLDRIRENMAEMSEVPQVAFSKVEGGGTSNLSGVALKLLYGPLLKKTERKQKSWGSGMERAMRFALIVTGMDDVQQDDIHIEWQDPLPSNDAESWTIAGEKILLGVSKDQVLRENGYTNEQIVQFKKESADNAAANAQQQAKLFAAGAVPNSPYNKPMPGKPNQPTAPAPAQNIPPKAS